MNVRGLSNLTLITGGIVAIIGLLFTNSVVVVVGLVLVGVSVGLAVVNYTGRAERQAARDAVAPPPPDGVARALAASKAARKAEKAAKAGKAPQQDPAHQKEGDA